MDGCDVGKSKICKFSCVLADTRGGILRPWESIRVCIVGFISKASKYNTKITNRFGSHDRSCVRKNERSACLGELAETVATSKSRRHLYETRAVRGDGRPRSPGRLHDFYVSLMAAGYLRLSWKSSFEGRKTKTC